MTKGVFGLEALFDVKSHTEETEPAEYILFAYLVLPDSFSVTSSRHSSMILDPEVLKPPTSKQSSRFEVAMRTLQLRPFARHRQFGRTERQSKLPRPCYCSCEMKMKTKGTSPSLHQSRFHTGLLRMIQDLADSEWPKLLLVNGMAFS